MNFLRSILNRQLPAFDIPQMDSDIANRKDSVSLEIENTIRRAELLINKRACYEDLKRYYLTNGEFPTRWVDSPHSCWTRIDQPGGVLLSKYNEYSKLLELRGHGLHMIKISGWTSMWCVYLTADYFPGYTKQ